MKKVLFLLIIFVLIFDVCVFAQSDAQINKLKGFKNRQLRSTLSYIQDSLSIVQDSVAAWAGILDSSNAFSDSIKAWAGIMDSANTFSDSIKAWANIIDTTTNIRTDLDKFTVHTSTFKSGAQADTIEISGADATDKYVFSWTSDPGSPGAVWITAGTDTCFVNCEAAVTATPSCTVFRRDE